MTKTQPVSGFVLEDDPIDLMKPFLEGTDLPPAIALPRLEPIEEDDMLRLNVRTRSLGRYGLGTGGYSQCYGDSGSSKSTSANKTGKTTSSSKKYTDSSANTGKPAKAKSEKKTKTSSKYFNSSPASKPVVDTKPEKNGNTSAKTYSTTSVAKPAKSKTNKKSNKYSESYGSPFTAKPGRPNSNDNKSEITFENKYSANTTFSSNPSLVSVSTSVSPEDAPSDTHDDNVPSPQAYLYPKWGYSLTTRPQDIVSYKAEETDETSVFFSSIRHGIKTFVNKIFKIEPEMKIDPGVDGKDNPIAATEFIIERPEVFRENYISQLDIEAAAGRPQWTFCCGTTLVYAYQTKYPDLENGVIINAASEAAKTELADGSGPCVSENGMVNSISQYSQAFAKNLGLEEYVDTPGTFATVVEAKKEGVTMAKLKLGGTIADEAMQHHVLQYGQVIIDPVPGTGIEKFTDEGSLRVEQVMALDWYALP